MTGAQIREELGKADEFLQLWETVLQCGFFAHASSNNSSGRGIDCGSITAEAYIPIPGGKRRLAAPAVVDANCFVSAAWRLAKQRSRRRMREVRVEYEVEDWKVGGKKAGRRIDFHFFYEFRS